MRYCVSLDQHLVLKTKPIIVDPTQRFLEVVETGRYGTNAYRGLLKIMKRAGLQCWPKLFHSMRDFRINEVANMEGITVGAMDAWFGNCEAVRRKHYASTEDHSVTRKRLAGGQISDASGQIVGSGETGTSSQEHVSSGTNLENILEKLLQAGEGLQEPLVEYIRRDSNPQPSVPKTDALSS